MKLILKQKVDDFYVEEILPKEYFKKSESEIRLYSAEKICLSHKEMEKILSDKSNNKTVHFSGIKDKDAHTFQYFTTYAKIPDFEWIENEKCLRINFIQNTDKPIHIGSHKENFFKIKTNHFKQNKGLLYYGTPNYFDTQRFGNEYYSDFINALLTKDYESALRFYLTRKSKNKETNRMRNEIREKWKNIEKLNTKTRDKIFEQNLHKKEIYKLIISKDFYNAIKQLNKRDLNTIYKQYQSALFNERLNEFVAKYKYKKFENKFFNVERIPQTEIKINANKELKELGIDARDLVRKSVFYPKRFKLTKIDNEHANIEFKLDKGNYATLLVKHLFIFNY